MAVGSNITIQVLPQPSNIALGSTESFTAIVQNAGSLSGVTWQVIPATGAGTIDLNGNYMAPSSAPATLNVTVTATSLADASKQGSVTFMLSANALGACCTQVPGVTLAVNTAAGGSGTVGALTGVPSTGSASTLPFTLSCSNLPAGSGCTFANKNNAVASGIVTGTNPISFVIIFTTGSASAPPATAAPLSEVARSLPLYGSIGSLLAFTLLALWVRGFSVRSRTRVYAVALLLALCISCGFMSSCVGLKVDSALDSSATVTPQGKYQVVITSTPPSGSGFVQTQLIVPLTVQ